MGPELGGWVTPGRGDPARSAVARCLAPFARLPVDADAALLNHWRSTGKFALCDPLDTTATCPPCDLANPGGGGDAWTSPKGRDRCRTTPGDAPNADRACYASCAGTLSEAHANVSITQVLRPDAALCRDD